MRCHAILLFLVLMPNGPAWAEGKADLVVLGDAIWTCDPDRPWAQGIAMRGEEIVAVGAREEIEPLISDATRVIDAGSGLVCPGWIDSHVHLFQGGRNLMGVQLRDADSKEEFARRIEQHAQSLPDGAWITGGDWDHTMWGGDMPTRQWIDEVSPHHPVWVQRLDGHMALANSVALRIAGMDASTIAPEGGVIDRLPDGEPSGLLRDNAMAIIDGVVPEPSAAQMFEALQAASDYLLENGVSTVCHMGTLDELRVLRAANATGKLRIRVFAATPLPQWEMLRDEIAQHGRGDTWLRVGVLKGLVDGSLGSHTAAFLDPYDDAPRDRGLLVNTAEDLYAWTSAADAAGLQVMVHAIGDRANRLQLDIFERVAGENGPRDRRFRIEHAQHLATDDLQRFVELGVIPSMQPYHAIDDGRWADPLIGADRSRTTYAFRSLIGLGVRPAFGSDWFVAPASPVMGVYAAVTRATLDGKRPNGWIPEQKIEVLEALEAYCSSAAYAIFAEEELGQLKPGYLADLVVLDRDLTRIEPSTIDQSRVLYTVIGGRVAYERSNDEPVDHLTP